MTIEHNTTINTYDDIVDWLNVMNIVGYHIDRNDLTVSVYGDVRLIRKGLTRIPIRFMIIDGSLNLGGNEKLESLIGCPKYTYEVSCVSTGISDFTGVPITFIIHAGYIKKLRSFYGLPDELKVLTIQDSCSLVDNITNFPTVIREYLTISYDFKFINQLHTHMKLLREIICVGEVSKYGNILKILNISGLELVRFTHNRTVAEILNSEIKRQPDPRKRNLLKVAQELSNAGYHHLTV